MSDDTDLPNLPGYLSIKDAAKLLGLSEKTVYQYVDEGRIPAVKAAHVIMILQGDVENFKRGSRGRPRKNVPTWRISTPDNVQFLSLIQVQIQPGKQTLLLECLEEIRKEQTHLFPGTVERYIANSQSVEGRVEIILVWRSTVMPSEEARFEALEAFRQALADVLDWETVQYTTSRVVMHT